MWSAWNWLCVFIWRERVSYKLNEVYRLALALVDLKEMRQASLLQDKVNELRAILVHEPWELRPAIRIAHEIQVGSLQYTNGVRRRELGNSKLLESANQIDTVMATVVTLLRKEDDKRRKSQCVETQTN